MQHFFSIFLPLALFSFACAGAGFLILGLLTMRKEINLVEFTCAFTMGQGILGSLLLIPALMGGFTKPVLLAMIIPLALLGLWKLGLSIPAMTAAIREALLTFYKTPFIWQLLTIGTSLLLLAGAAAFTGKIDGDARAFYLALPKVIAASHRLVPLPGAYENFTSVGLIAEMQLAALFLLDMPGASPRLFSWVTGLAGTILLVAISKSAGLGRRGQLLSVVMLLTSSAVAYFFGGGKTDLFAAVFALAGVLFALKNADGVANRRSTLFIAGLFTGFALVAKLSYIVGFLPSMFILLFWKDIYIYWRSRSAVVTWQNLLRKCLLESLIFTGAVLIPAIPHFFKNYILLRTLVDTYGAHHYFSNETTLRIIFTYPVWPFFGRFWAQYGFFSPLMFAFLPAMLWGIWKDRGQSAPVIAIGVASAVGLLAWIVIFPSVPMPRYYLATWLLLIVPVAWVMERISRSDKLLNHVVVLAALVCMFLFFKAMEREIFKVANAYEYLVGEQSEKNLHVEEVLSRNVYEAINQSAEPGARVFLGAYFRFWLRPDLLQCTNNGIETSSEILFDAANPEKFWVQLYEHGFSYIFMEKSHRYFTALDNIPAWVRIEMIYPQGDYGGAYRLTFVDPPSKVRFVTKEVSPGAWDVVPAR